MQFNSRLFNSIILGVLMCHGAAAQIISLDYISDFQTTPAHQGKDGFRWANYLRLGLDVPLAEGLSFNAATISVGNLREDRLLNDFLVFSNIDNDNLPLAIADLGISWTRGRSSFFAGVRNVNEEFFVSDVTSFFISSPGGIFPTIGSNFPIANYPAASTGIEYVYDGEWFGLVATLMNGRGSDRITGRDNVFRFCPSSDGLFSMASAEYHKDRNLYQAGACIHYGRTFDEGTMDTRCALWAMAEQELTPWLRLMVHASTAPSREIVCSAYAGMGLLFDIRKTQLGVFSTWARFRGDLSDIHADNSFMHETATEISWHVPVCKVLGGGISLQPVLHLIHQSAGGAFSRPLVPVALLRLALSL